jgi:prevent-host-death family protein
VARIRQVALAKVRDDLSRYLHLAEKGEIVITRHGKPAGVLVGFKTEGDWFEYRLEHHPEFLSRVAEARQALARKRGVAIEDLEK